MDTLKKLHQGRLSELSEADLSRAFVELMLMAKAAGVYMAWVFPDGTGIVNMGQ
jgi:hypothetical protein